MSSSVELQHKEVEAIATDAFPGATLLDEVEIIAKRRGGLIEGYVPIDLINQEEVVVDAAHVAELAASMTSLTNGRETGQLSPILLGHIVERPSLSTIDGFHRTAVIRDIGYKTVYATIKPDCSPEELFDLRIISASSHKKVKFPRIIEWVEEAWQLTPWAKKGFSSLSAFTLVSSNQSGEHSKLQPDEIEAVYEWVQTKCEQWRIKAWTIQGYLRTARGADPDLVKIVQEKNRRVKSDALSTKQLAIIVQYLGGEYDRQRRVAEVTIENQLTVAQTKALSLAVSRTRDPDELEKCFADRVWERAASDRKSLTKRRYGAIDLNSPETYVETILNKFFDDEITIAELLIQNAILRGVFVPKRDEVSATVIEVITQAGLTIAEPIVDAPETVKEASEVGVAEKPIEDIPEQEREIPDQAAVNELAQQVVAMAPYLAGVVRRTAVWFNEQDTEDVLSTVAMKFIEGVRDGRLGIAYTDMHLKRILAQFVVNATIDEVRQRRGRDGSKQQALSINDVNDAGKSLGDKLQAEDPFSDQYHNRRSNSDFLKKLLPLLTDNESRTAVLKLVYDLSYKQIAAIIGVNPPSVAGYYHTLKKKAAKLTENLQASDFL